MALQSYLLSSTLSAPGDSCPGVFWVEVRNPRAAVARGALEMGSNLELTTINQSFCEQTFVLLNATETSGSFVSDIGEFQVGRWQPVGPPPLNFPAAACLDLPQRFGSVGKLTERAPGKA